ncbi:lipoprotein [Parahaliea sp. F7430]|uniref:Lipoprotein n=1 Tax=Sediminihaliea albiluteola TaxID=2758564 RepID=A0A7W2YJP5_9GAMM|nr:lipoprotein [Sediminihaliea albiluteola]MBA6413287.1 lipoprotein [Sediminihaliea albiluteola]
MRELLVALTVLCSATLLQACGQTGPLYMPDEPAKVVGSLAPTATTAD